MKKLLKAFIISTVLTAAASTVQAAPVRMTLTYDGYKHSYNAESIALEVNGDTLTLTEMPPIILNGRTYVPAREVFEPLGAVVDWKASTQEVYIGYGGNLVIMKANRTTANVNGKDVRLESPAKLINNKLMLPARFVADQFDIPVEWDNAERIVSIGTKQIVAAEDPVEPVATAPAVTEPVTDVPATSDPVVTEPISTAPVITEPVEPEVPFNNNPSIPGLSADISTYLFTEQAASPVSITNVAADGLNYVISASGAISKVDKQLLAENKLVLDIHNATNTLPGLSTLGNYAGVTAVRSSQFATDPVKITRVVFDLSGATRYSVSMSADRRAITVSFESGTIQDIKFAAVSDVSEQITIISDVPQSFKVSREHSPDRLFLDATAKTTISVGDKKLNGRLVTSYNVSQPNSTTTRISLMLGANVQYAITPTETGATVTITEATYKNIEFDELPNADAALTLRGLSGIDPASILHTDNYLSGEYKLTLPGDYSAQLGNGTYPIEEDSNLESVTITTVGGKTELTFKQSRILGYKVSPSGSDLVVHALDPREIYPIVIYLDAGHGASDSGASANGIKEKDVNLDIMLRLYRLLEADPSFKVYASRLEDTYPKNIDRATTANSVADLFVSIHHNAASNTTSNGTEVLYYNHAGETDPNITSEAVARVMQKNLVDALGTTSRGVVRRPDLIVLNSTNIPAVLVEIGFLTHSGDAAKIKNESVRQAAADALYRSIQEIFTTYPTGR